MKVPNVGNAVISLLVVISPYFEPNVFQYKMSRKLSGLGGAGDVMGRNNGESVTAKPISKETLKQREAKKRVVVGLVTSFSCPHCEKAFAQKTSLTKHVKTHQRLTDKESKEPPVKESIGSKKVDLSSSGKENLPDQSRVALPLPKQLNVLTTKKVANSKATGNKSRLEVLRVSQVSSAMKSLISPASGGRSKIRRVLKKKSGGLLERPKLASKKVRANIQNREQGKTFDDGMGSKSWTKPESQGVMNGSAGQSGLMYPGWHASSAGANTCLFKYFERRHFTSSQVVYIMLWRQPQELEPKALGFS